MVTHHDPALDPENQHYHTHPSHHGLALQTVEPVIHADAHVGPRESDPIAPEKNTSPIHSTNVEKDVKNLQVKLVDQENKSIDSGDIIEGYEETQSRWRLAGFYSRFRVYFDIFWACFFTAWWISLLVQDTYRHDWLIPTIVYLCIIARFITFYLPVKYLLVGAKYVWDRTAIKVVDYIPEKWRHPAGALLTVGVILIGTFATKDYDDSLRSDRAISFFGCVIAIFCLYVTSANRKAIDWHPVITGMLMQYIIALFVLRTKCGYDIFNFISKMARLLLGYAKDGVAFITSEPVSQLGMFFFTVLPAIIFFVTIVHIFYYWGCLQWFVVKFASFFFWSMRISGAEAVVAAASPFIGQGESAILVKPFISHLTRAEIHQIMTSGFATIAGSVLVAYLGFGINPQAAISSCVMSIPAAIACSKLRFPETEETLTSGRVVVPDDDVNEAKNTLHAFANGAWLGIVIAGTILANILCIIALIALINALLGWFAHYWNINDPELSLEMILGYIFYPVAFLLGAPRNELFRIAKLIGIKIIQNEFVAYISLSHDPDYADLSKRGSMLATYALCGFANLGSVGTVVGVLGQIAPTRITDIASLALSSLITGAISTLLSAAVAGMVMADLSNFVTPFEFAVSQAAASA
ncbi:hypothetical protein NADFUDRAFT_45934 [Nadsonia fulvescens var. elongata DSM 6958]|uniref:H+/nucleoside cotransporter n=1 Tax=Nadsonia fulvescens var. elongata DSM 6958 TaxID=857566 RepID=A0A1E3PM20_9ASCO|nr:hypothetical protein NADFUDRAFT_45934 [Nadsonia fulvescens var. elongata DSM 6958]